MGSKIISICVDCTDAELLADFWTAVLGWQVKARGWQSTDHGKDGVSIGTDEGALEIDFRWVPDGAKTIKNRLHLDINPTDRDQDEELERLIGLGARPVDVGQRNASWHVLVDPEGNEFCLCRDTVDP